MNTKGIFERTARSGVLIFLFVMALFLFPFAEAGAVSINQFQTLPGPEEITAGPDGNFWFTESVANSIGRITPSGVITHFAVPTPGGYPAGITVGPDNNLWFAENGADRIGRITTAGAITEYPVTAGSGPWGITVGPDNNLWFTEYGAGRIGVITPTGAVTEYALTAGSSPLEITTGPDHNLWFTEKGTDKIGVITAAGNIIQQYTLTTGSGPWGITTGPDGNMWFTESGTSYIGRLIPGTGEIKEFSLYATLSGEPTGITVGSDGNLWFSDYYLGNIGRITPAGAVTEFPLPISFSEPKGLVTGPDGNLWIAEWNANKIGQLLVVTTGPAHIVTPSAGPNGSISPDTAQTVNYGLTTSFTLTPASGYLVSSVTGCGGLLSGSTYTTGAITADCTVTATFSNTAPTAGFSASPLSDPAPVAVNFSDTSTNYPSSWSWSFGDGGVSALQNPTHTYQEPGAYTVSLTVSNAKGSNTSTMTNYITASCPVLPARIDRTTPLYYSTLQSVLDAAMDADVVQVQGTTLTESPVLGSGADVTLEGGYDQCYTANTGTYSTISGSLTVSLGTLTVENVIIQ